MTNRKRSPGKKPTTRKRSTARQGRSSGKAKREKPSRSATAKKKSEPKTASGSTAKGDPAPEPNSPPDIDLAPQHLALIQASAITPEVMRDRGYRTIRTKADLRRLGFSDRQCRVPALLVPVWNVNGEIATYQIRPDQPRISKGKATKYETPKGSRMTLDVPLVARPWLADPARPLFVTEGARKADAGVSAEICAIALLGVWNWRGTNEHGGKTALPDWESIALNGRDAYIVFDSDVMTKRAVHAALTRLKAFLEQRGANVQIAYLPAGEGGAKVGLDDYLAAGHGVDDLLSLATPELLDPQQGPGEDDASDGTLTSALVSLAEREIVQLFHDSRQEPHATIRVDSRRETHRIKDRSFKRWMRHVAFKFMGRSVTANVLSDACGLLESKALFESVQREAHVRVADNGQAIFLDLGRTVARIGTSGVEIVEDCPIPFRRPPGFRELPEPVKGGSIGALRRFVNCADADWPLILGWLVAALRPRGPYPVLVLLGEQGSAKSTTLRVLRSLLDPNAAPLRSEPKEARDLMIAATNAWAPGFDNLSSIPPWLSDALCRLSTGGGFATRTLYSDDEEMIFDAQRPVAVTGIEDIISRPDLLDRSVLVYAPPIPEEERKSEREFWAEFERERPGILGALLKAVSVGLRNIDKVTLDHAPRMADFAQWVVACEPALGLDEGEFLEAYEANREAAIDLGLESSPVAQAVRSLMTKSPRGLEVTATHLLELLSKEVGDKPPRGWPRTPRGLSGAIRRAAPNFRSVGIDIYFFKKPHTRERMIQLSHQVSQGDGRGTDAGGGTDEPPPTERALETPGEGIGDGGDGGDGRSASCRQERAGDTPPDGAGEASSQADAHTTPAHDRAPAEPYPPYPPSPTTAGSPEGNGRGAPSDDRLAAEERAAIQEHDGGLPREVAERRAGLFPEAESGAWEH